MAAHKGFSTLASAHNHPYLVRPLSACRRASAWQCGSDSAAVALFVDVKNRRAWDRVELVGMPCAVSILEDDRTGPSAVVMTAREATWLLRGRCSWVIVNDDMDNVVSNEYLILSQIVQNCVFEK